MPAPINKPPAKPGPALGAEAARRRAIIPTKNVFAQVPSAKEEAARLRAAKDMQDKRIMRDKQEVYKNLKD